MQPPKAILFDLDGTLADTVAGIAWSMNHTLENLGLPTHPTDAYRRFVGNGIRKLVERALPDDWAHRVDEVAAIYPAVLETQGTAMAKVYAGITDMLEQLAGAGVQLAVLSNKPHNATITVIDHLFAKDRFDIVRGHIEGTPVKPDPTSAREVLALLGCMPDKAWYVGDSEVDIQLARATGMRCISITWGLRDRDELEAHQPDHLIDKPEELVALCCDGHGR